MVKRIALAAVVTTLLTFPTAALAKCVPTQVRCKKVTVEPSGTKLVFVLTKKNRDSKPNGVFNFFLTSYKDVGGKLERIKRAKVPLDLFKASSKLKSMSAKKSPDEDTANIALKVYVTPSIGTITVDSIATPTSLGFAG